jgi:hypothetical protein
MKSIGWASSRGSRSAARRAGSGRRGGWLAHECAGFSSQVVGGVDLVALVAAGGLQPVVQGAQGDGRVEQAVHGTSGFKGREQKRFLLQGLCRDSAAD